MSIVREGNNLLDNDLPTALNSEMFDDLPFEQKRQALREEVERAPRITPNRSPHYELKSNEL